MTAKKPKPREADLSDPADLALAQLLMDWGIEEGAIPRDRPALTGHEEAVFLEADTPAGRNTVVAGMVYYQPDGHDLLFVDVLYVSEPYRRRDIGGTLLTFACNEALARGLPEVRFGTLVGNGPMQALGEVCGFTPLALFMSKRIGAGRMQ